MSDWQHWLQQSYSTLSWVSTGMGDYSWVHVFVTSHPGQLSLTFSVFLGTMSTEVVTPVVPLGKNGVFCDAVGNAMYLGLSV